MDVHLKTLFAADFSSSAAPTGFSTRIVLYFRFLKLLSKYEKSAKRRELATSISEERQQEAGRERARRTLITRAAQETWQDEHEGVSTARRMQSQTAERRTYIRTTVAGAGLSIANRSMSAMM